VEEDQVEEMKKLLAAAGDKIMLPVDHIVTDAFDFKTMTGGKRPRPGVPGFLQISWYGHRSADDPLLRAGYLRRRTVVWNGPMGVFEAGDYATGTRAIAQALANATDKGTVSVIGGGDSAAAVEELGLEARMTHVSTGGGASLEYLEGRPMPPIEVLDKK